MSVVLEEKIFKHLDIFYLFCFGSHGNHNNDKIKILIFNVYFPYHTDAANKVSLETGQ